MKKILRTLAAVSMGGLILLFSAGYANAYIWQPTDINSMAINLATGDPMWSLILMDAEAEPTDVGLETLTLVSGGALGMTQIVFGLDTATVGTDTIDLGTDLFFKLYFYDGVSVYNMDYSITPVGDNLFELGSGISDMTVTVSDMSPIPIPSAGLLLISGLIGIVRFRRKTGSA